MCRLADCCPSQLTACCTLLLQVIVCAAAPITAEEVAQKPGTHMMSQQQLDWQRAFLQATWCSQSCGQVEALT
jgi:hypothetical protein